MDQAGYTRVDSQNEITGSGPFDLKHIQQRKSNSQRGLTAKTYPNPLNVNLGVLPGEVLLYRKAQATMMTKSGGQKLAVFSSLNGYTYAPHRTVHLAKRSLGFAGVSKTLYTLDGESQMNGSYQTSTGIAWLESGSISIERNTGPYPIPAGCLVYLEMPPMAPQYNPSAPNGSMISPNNAGYGMANGKWVMQTLPFSPLHTCDQLMTYNALFLTSHDAEYNPGIGDSTIDHLLAPNQSSRSRRHADAAQAAGALYYGVFGIFFGVLEALVHDHEALIGQFGTDAQNSGKQQAIINLMTAMGVMAENAADKGIALNCINNVMLSDVANAVNRRTVETNFKNRNAAAFNMNSNTLKDPSRVGDEKAAVRYAHMRRGAVRNIFIAEADAACETNRWIIGRAMHTSHPGKTLDINIGDHNRPLSK